MYIEFVCLLPNRPSRSHAVHTRRLKLCFDLLKLTGGCKRGRLAVAVAFVAAVPLQC